MEDSRVRFGSRRFQVAASELGASVLSGGVEVVVGGVAVREGILNGAVGVLMGACCREQVLGTLLDVGGERFEARSSDTAGDIAT